MGDQLSEPSHRHHMAHLRRRLHQLTLLEANDENNPLRHHAVR
ncbi:MAG: hypothetical protein VKM17_06155 [Cyanobacteriota bacterium]|nr:hypothetical protein [Cyanobacteriota bacterium]